MKAHQNALKHRIEHYENNGDEEVRFIGLLRDKKGSLVGTLRKLKKSFFRIGE